MTQPKPQKQPKPPPRSLVRTIWKLHRSLFAITGGRLGSWRQKGRRPGMLRLHTRGRRSGQERVVMLGYLEDGPNLALVAMNGWADPDPAWWLNLQAEPHAVVDLGRESREVVARRATPAERARLWPHLGGTFGDLDAWAALRSRETAVVILEPR